MSLHPGFPPAPDFPDDVASAPLAAEFNLFVKATFGNLELKPVQRQQMWTIFIGGARAITRSCSVSNRIADAAYAEMDAFMAHVDANLGRRMS